MNRREFLRVIGASIASVLVFSGCREGILRSQESMKKLEDLLQSELGVSFYNHGNILSSYPVADSGMMYLQPARLDMDSESGFYIPLKNGSLPLRATEILNTTKGSRTWLRAKSMQGEFPKMAISYNPERKTLTVAQGFEEWKDGKKIKDLVEVFNIVRQDDDFELVDSYKIDISKENAEWLMGYEGEIYIVYTGKDGLTKISRYWLDGELYQREVSTNVAVDPSRIMIVKGFQSDNGDNDYYLVAESAESDEIVFINTDSGSARSLDGETLNEIFGNEIGLGYSGLRLGPILADQGPFVANIVAEDILDYFLPVGIGEKGFYKAGSSIVFNR